MNERPWTQWRSPSAAPVPAAATAAPAPLAMLVALITLGLLLPLGCAAATIDPSVLENPRGIVLDRACSARWEALFEQNPRWVSRQIAYLESHQPDQILTLLVARLLYRGEPWLRRSTDATNIPLWRHANLEVRSAILRTLRSHRDSVLGDYLCQYLFYEQDPALVTSALGFDLYLIDPQSVPAWAVRLADPRNPQQRLPGSLKIGVRERCLTFLVETAGIDSALTRQALDWALLHCTGSERNHAIEQIQPGEAQDLLVTTVLGLTNEFRQGIIDDEGRLGLVMAITRLTGTADHDLVLALMELATKADRSVATTAATALATSLQWKTAVAINDLAHRATQDADPAIRQSLLAFLVRLDPAAVAAAAGPDSPWTILAQHEAKLAAWARAREAK